MLTMFSFHLVEVTMRDQVEKVLLIGIEEVVMKDTVMSLTAVQDPGHRILETETDHVHLNVVDFMIPSIVVVVAAISDGSTKHNYLKHL